jgi:hypothetical protein
VALSVLMFMICPLGFAESSDNPLQQLQEDYSWGKVSSSAGNASASGATGESSQNIHEYRMEQQRDKLKLALLLSITALIAQFVVLRAFPSSERSATHIVSATGLIYIVFGTTILVVIANTDQQLTASMGILGAVAGYLFGRIRRDDGQEGEKNSAHP